MRCLFLSHSSFVSSSEENSHEKGGEGKGDDERGSVLKNCTRSGCGQCVKSGDVGSDYDINKCGGKRRREDKQDDDESHVTRKMKLLKL